MKIQWYPGHMTKAVRNMQEDVKVIDLIIEMVDARAPLATRNPDVDRLGQNKGRIIVLNKSDMAEEKANKDWKDYFTALGYECMYMDSRRKADMRELMNCIERASAAKRERDRARGIINRPVRAMVAGIPNVGKSTLINTIAGRSAAKTGNKPGVTKGNQWIRLNRQIELLDTPGILWPKFEDEHVGEMIAYIGSVNDLIVNKSELSECLGNWLLENKADELIPNYNKNADIEISDYQSLMNAVVKSRGCLKPGGEPDYDKAENILINDFRSGKLGRITLERVPQ
ncbi:MAG: ribosome biogenesis GTPase YlqF [Lachnospiraceae bacterium]|nr:ribosome biogenesis GTPase YlqF [Lachnospiraceae bacterium]